jgi:hypothetical protein
MESDPLEQFEQQINAERMESVRSYLQLLAGFVMNTPLPPNLEAARAEVFFRFDDGKLLALTFDITPDAVPPASTDATPKGQ